MKDIMRYVTAAGWLTAGLFVAPAATAQVTAPSFWTDIIQVQGEAEGAEFDDWAAEEVPIATTDDLDNSGFVDINTVQIANDSDFIYIRVTYHDAKAVGTFLGFDTDQDTATGFDVFQLGEIGTELGYSNDFPFEQGTGVFNTGDPLTGGPVNNGGALIFPFFNIESEQKEYAIPLDAGFTNPIAPAFTSDTFDLIVYTDQGGADVTEVITYTLAEAPTLQGDYNGDLVVDAADYTIWRDTLNDIGAELPADGNGDMVVDQADYVIWRDNYGSGEALSAVGIATPEPASALLALLLVAGAGARGRRGRDLS